VAESELADLEAHQDDLSDSSNEDYQPIP
jgi:hypothetical protein